MRDREIRTILRTTSLAGLENPENCTAEIQRLWRNFTLGIP